MRFLVAILVIFVGGLVYVRLAPIKLNAYFKTDVPTEIGDYAQAGGFTAVRALEGAADEVLDRVATVMTALPHTKKISDAPLTFVTRSAFFGFPDVTQVTVANEHLILRGHLVFGASDLGVNKARILAVLTSI